MNLRKLTATATSALVLSLAGSLAAPAHAAQPVQTPCLNPDAPCIAAWVAPVAPDGIFTVTGYFHGAPGRVSIAISNDRTRTVLRYVEVVSAAMTGDDYAGYSQFRAELPFRPGGATLWGYRSDLSIVAQAITGGIAGAQSNIVRVYSPGFKL